jgi:hypothetical protein
VHQGCNMGMVEISTWKGPKKDKKEPPSNSIILY